MGEAGLPRYHVSWTGEKGVGGLSLDSMPEGVQATEGAGVGGERVGPIGKYGKEEALSDAVAMEGPNAGTAGG